MSRVEKILAAIQAADDPAGFTNDECSGGKVPFAQTGLPECIETAGRDVAEIESGGARPADPTRVHQNSLQHVHIRRKGDIGVAKWKAGADQRAFERGLITYPNAPAIQLRALTAGCREEFLTQRIINGRMLGSVLVQQAYRDAIDGKPVQEIGRTIQWIDDPDVVGLTVLSAFLGKNRMLRIVFEDCVDNCLFGIAIHFADIIVATFLLDLDLVEPGKAANDCVAATVCCHHGNIKQCMHSSIPTFVKRASSRKGAVEYQTMTIRIILVGTTHPGNIGAAARAMKNMGLSDLMLVRPRYFPHDDATARASGAEDILEAARVVDSLDEALCDCVYVAGASARSRTIGWPSMTPRECANRLLQESRHGTVAAVFGSEKAGLTNKDIDRCHTLLTIPTEPGFCSLNLAMAVQVIAYELRVAQIGEVKEHYISETPPATGEELEHFYAHLEEVLTDGGFLDPDNPRHLMRRLRRLFVRARPDQNEINILRGMLSALDPKAGNRAEN